MNMVMDAGGSGAQNKAESLFVPSVSSEPVSLSAPIAVPSTLAEIIGLLSGNHLPAQVKTKTSHSVALEEEEILAAVFLSEIHMLEELFAL